MYNILWLDDDFIGPDYSNGDDIVNARREGFLDDANQAKKFELVIEPALNIGEFKKKFSSDPEKYQAVVLDIMDLNPNDSSDESALAEALKLVEKTNVLTYVYSNNPDKPGHKDYIKVHIPSDRVISKAGNVGDCLYSKIVSDLNDENRCFNGHKECLDLLNMGYLSSYGQMKTLLKNIEDDTYLPFNDMRQVLENMLDTLTQVGVIPTQTVGADTYSTFNKKWIILQNNVKQEILTEELSLIGIILVYHIVIAVMKLSGC